MLIDSSKSAPSHALDQSKQTLLTVEQTAKFLQVSFWTLLLWRKQHKGPPYIKNGHFIRYAESDLLEWLQSKKVSPASLRTPHSV